MNEASLWSTLNQTVPLFLWPLFKLEILSAEPKRRFAPLKPLALPLYLKQSLLEDIKHALNGTFSFVPDMLYPFLYTLLMMP